MMIYFAYFAISGPTGVLAWREYRAQRAIVADRTRVRVLVGQPGAGKTTSLQSAASRLDGRALLARIQSL